MIGTVAKRKYFARDGATARVLAAMLVLCAAPISVWGETGNTSLAKPGHPVCDRAGFRVVVDVGHTADVPGARSARVVSEYFFNLRLAKQYGCKIVVDTDAHSTEELDQMRCGITQLRRAWLTPADILNTQPTAEALLEKLRPKPG